MATVRDILAKKGSQVWSLGGEATVLQAAQFMTEHRIGAVLSSMANASPACSASATSSSGSSPRAAIPRKPRSAR